MTNEAIDQLKRILGLANKGGLLTIIGYENSQGAVADYTVQMIGKEGYLDLVRQSLKLLNEGGVQNQGFDPEVWQQAVEEKKASFTKTLSGPQREINSNRVIVPGDGYFQYEDDPDIYVITNLRRISHTVKQAGEVKEVKSSPKTLAKSSIDKQLPISEFIGRMNIAEGKFEAVLYAKDQSHQG